MSTKEIESAGVRHVLTAEANGDLHARHPYIYALAEDLRVADVEVVLSAYKELVRLLTHGRNTLSLRKTSWQGSLLASA